MITASGIHYFSNTFMYLENSMCRTNKFCDAYKQHKAFYANS